MHLYNANLSRNLVRLQTPGKRKWGSWLCIFIFLDPSWNVADFSNLNQQVHSPSPNINDSCSGTFPHYTPHSDESLTPGSTLFLGGGGFDLWLFPCILGQSKLLFLQTVSLLNGVVQPIRLHDVDLPLFGKLIFWSWTRKFQKQFQKLYREESL